MSGVWVFNNGVIRLPENPSGCEQKRKALVHIPSGEAMRSYEVLEAKLTELGWERNYDDPDMYRYHKRGTVHLISLPKDFARFKSMHMYDIVVKNRSAFRVVDVDVAVHVVDQADAGQSEVADAGQVDA